MKREDSLRVEACAFLRFFCSRNIWSRVGKEQELTLWSSLTAAAVISGGQRCHKFRNVGKRRPRPRRPSGTHDHRPQMKHQSLVHRRLIQGPRGMVARFRGDDEMKNSDLTGALKHAEHDGANKREGDVRGQYAQVADEWTKGHPPLPSSRHCTDGRVGEEVSNAFFGKKVRFAVYAPHNRG